MLSQERNTPARHPGRWSYPVAANVKIFAGALVAIEAGYLVPGKVAVGLIAQGRAEATVDNTGGASGALSAPVERGCFLFANKADDAVTQADVGKDCFIVDDETVARTNGTSTRSRAGLVRAVEPGGGVWVEF